jgi:isopentenyl phosphate kinase
MVPKVRAALAGIAAPGAEAIICDAAAPGALARALDDPTFGTRISGGRPAAATGAAAGATT